MNTIFVYGTLKQGYHNNQLLRGSRFVGRATSLSPYAMLDGRGFPYLAEAADGHPVRGELFEVSDEVLANVDRLEGYPHHYTREVRQFATLDGRVHSAWVYLISLEKLLGYGDPAQPVDGALQWHRYRVGDQVVNVFSPAIVGEVIDPSPKPGHVQVRWPSNGDLGLALPLSQVCLHRDFDMDEDFGVEDEDEDEEGDDQ